MSKGTGWGTQTEMNFRATKGDRRNVILVGRMCLTTDYLARELGRRGARVHLFTPPAGWPLPSLRAAYPYHSQVWEPFENQPSESFAAMVESVDAECIIPCTEQALYWLWNQPAHIQERCLPNVKASLRPLLFDRALLLERAASWGVATPESMLLNNRDDCRAAIEKGLPLMVKSGQSMASNGVALCRSSDEVMSAFDEFSKRGTSVEAQRYYVGPTYVAGGLFTHGEAKHFYAGEQTVMRPSLTGVACEVKSAGEPHLSTLLRATETVCRNLDWNGLAAFDFVLDESGQFRFLDFNPRLWGSAGALIKAKVDLYGGLDRLIRNGNAGPPSRAVPGVTYRVFPKYTIKYTDISIWQRLKGLRDAPFETPFLAASELFFYIVMKHKSLL